MTEAAPSDDRWQEVEALFHEVLALDPDDRSAYLAARCADDTTVRLKIERLLRHDRESEAFLDSAKWRPIVTGVASSMAQNDDDPLAHPGNEVGRYRLIERIASGGMGTVWLAERVDGEFEQKVAIKLIKRGMDTDDILHRFQNERQLLANFKHPHIARLFDGGATDDGRPYLVMEYVDGVPIDQYCSDHRLSIPDRLRLFQRVCNAIHEAHKNLIVHRDLKPSNILVATDGEPKLLDFGIAKVLDPVSAAGASMTATALRLLTPRYASPEQVRGDAITTASDVYSLGVILYELLTGSRPYDMETDSRQELERLVTEQNPTRPSVRVARSGNARSSTTSAAGLPELNVRKLRRTLAGDLDTIVLTALRKEPQGRYGSAEQLADDLRRYVDGLPIIARRTGVCTRCVKALRRHRREFAASIVGGFLALALAVAITVYLFVVPTWVQSHLDAARLALLDPEQSNNVVIAVYQQRSDYALNPREGSVERALAHYDAALRLYPTRSDIRRERDVVRLAAGETSALDVSSLDVRSLGLLAMLTADVMTAVEAWSEMDFVTNPDPLVEGLLGIYYLANDEPARAYPRLTSAYKSLPEAGFLCVSLAEAAARCGDGESALELIERAKSLDKFDDGTGGAERVEALALIAAGQLDDALELYEYISANPYNPVAFLQYAELLESLGREHEAVILLVRGIRIVSHWTKINRSFINRANRWWSGLSDSERQALVESRRHDDPTDPESFSALLFAYGVASRALDRADPDASAPAPTAVEPTLADLAAPIAITDLMGWIRCNQDSHDELAMQIRADLAGPHRTLSPQTRQGVLDHAPRYANRFYFAGY